MRRLEPFLENLRPAAKKFITFPTNRKDISVGKARLSVKEISSPGNKRMATGARIVPRASNAGEAYSIQLPGWMKRRIEKMALSDDGWAETQRFVLGKSLVGGSVTVDIFETSRLARFPLCASMFPAEPAKAGSGCGACWPMEFLCRISPRARTDALGTSGASRDRLAKEPAGYLYGFVI